MDRPRLLGSGSFGIVASPPVPQKKGVCPSWKRLEKFRDRLVGKILFDKADYEKSVDAQRVRRSIDPKNQATIPLHGSCLLNTQTQIKPYLDEKVRQSLQHDRPLANDYIELFYQKVNGSDLYNYLDQNPPRQPIRAVLRRFLPVFRLLQRMGKKKLAHLDIKPQNILVSVHPTTNTIMRLYLNDWDFLSDPFNFLTVNDKIEYRTHIMVNYMPPEYYPPSLRREHQQNAMSRRAEILLSLGYTPVAAATRIVSEFLGRSSFFASSKDVDRASPGVMSGMDVYSMGLVLLQVLTTPAFAPFPIATANNVADLRPILDIIGHVNTESLQKAYRRGAPCRTAIKSPKDRVYRDVVQLVDKMLMFDPSKRISIDNVIARLGVLFDHDSKK